MWWIDSFITITLLHFMFTLPDKIRLMCNLAFDTLLILANALSVVWGKNRKLNQCGI